MKIKKLCMVLGLVGMATMSSFYSGGAWADSVEKEKGSSGLPADYNFDAVELFTLQKFINIEASQNDLYKILSVERQNVVDPYYGKPGLRVRINYRSSQCELNYYQGTAFLAGCEESSCPVAIVYKKCL